MTYKPKLRDILHQWNKQRLIKRRAASSQKYPHKLAVLGIMKNETLNVDEWIGHYLAMGAAKVFLIDNGSTDDTLAKVKKWEDAGQVACIQRPTQYKQVRHYWDAIKKFDIKKNFEWLIIADLDEFWFCPDGQPIAEKLKNEDFALLKLVYANWRQFGSSGFTDHPKSIRTELVKVCSEMGTHSLRKFMVRTNQLWSRYSFDVHYVIGVPSRAVVSDNHNFHLNHYQIQSREYFETSKMRRGDAVHVSRNTLRDWAYFDKLDAQCTEEDRCLSDLILSGRFPDLK